MNPTLMQDLAATIVADRHREAAAVRLAAAATPARRRRGLRRLRRRPAPAPCAPTA